MTLRKWLHDNEATLVPELVRYTGVPCGSEFIYMVQPEIIVLFMLG